MHTCQPPPAADDALQPWFHGRKLYHVTPLHYLPGILWRGELIASSLGETFGVAPRKTARRRDRMLHLNGFVHLALDLAPPLLRDKLAKGMPHAALVWQAEDVARAHKCALIPYNTKAWRTKACYELISHPTEMTALMRRRDEFGRFRSVEVLVERHLSLHSLKEIVVFHPRDEPGVRRLLAAFPRDEQAPSVTVVKWSYSSEHPALDPHDLDAYYDNCIKSGRMLPPPDLLFD